MGKFLDLALLLFGFSATSAWAQIGLNPPNPNEPLEAPSKSPALAVTASASFENAEIFGIKLVNGAPTNVKLSFVNEEPEAVAVQFVGGSLWTPDFDPSGSRIVRNLTTKQYAIEIPAGEKQTLPYSFQTNMHPQELRLNLAAVVSKDNAFFTVQAFNGTVAIVEPDSSIFDPQIIFLYLFLLACTGAVGYFFYTIWIAPYFPQKKRGGKKTTVTKKIDVGGDVDGAEGPATSTGIKSFQDEWVPAHHLQRPEAKRVKSSGRPKSRQGKE